MDLLLTDTYLALEGNATTAVPTEEPTPSPTPGPVSASEALVVTVVGLGIVFIGLVLLIAIVKLIGTICKAAFGEKKAGEKAEKPAVKAPAKHVAASNLTEAQRGELVAAISCAIAENMGKPVSGIRIHSIRKVG